jgi:inosose dehydratase
MKLGYSTWGMPTVPIDSALRHLADTGYDGVEITVIPGWITELSTLDSAERKRILGLTQQYGLALVAIDAHSNFVEPDPLKLARNMARLKEAMDLAVEWTAGDVRPVVVTTPGGVPEQYDELKPLLVERLCELMEYAELRGVTVALEAHVGASIDTPEHAVEIMRMVDSPFLRLNFDISHFNVLGIPIHASVSAMAPYAAHTHIKDERGRYPQHQFLIPGEGDFDYVTYLREMQQVGYTGYIVPEISIMVQKRPAYDPLATATQSYTVVAQAFHEAGIVR